MSVRVQSERIKMDFTNMPIEAIDIGNIYENTETFLLRNTYDSSGTKLNDLNDLYRFITVLLRDLINIVVNINLRSITTFRYQIFGGKAFERIIKPTYPNVDSFDFDIELDETNEQIIEFAKILTTKLNSYANYQFGQMKYFIKNLLLKYDLVDDSVVSYYKNSQYNLFHFGTRKTSGSDKKLGIFIKLPLKPDLFINKMINRLDEHDVDFNHIYYPICDLKPLSSTVKYNPVISDNINYAPINSLIYGFLHAIINNTKVDKNVMRLGYLSDSDSFLCNPDFFIPFNVLEWNRLRLKNLVFSGMNMTIIDDGLNTLMESGLDSGMVSAPLNSSDILKNYVNSYYNLYRSRIVDDTQNCDNYYTNFNTNANTNSFRMKVNRYHLFEQIKDIVSATDASEEKSIMKYTGNDYLQINLYLQLKNVGLENAYFMKPFLGNSPDTYRRYGENILRVYDKLLNNKSYIDLVDELFNDEFMVVSAQNYFYFNSPEGKISDTTSIIQEVGSIIYLPDFMSTAYAFFSKFGEFMKPGRVLYKIKIKNKKGMGKNWILLNEYSFSPDEKEILIKAGSYFVIENIDYAMFERMNQPFNAKVITLRLCENMQDAIEYSKKFGYNHFIYNHFDKSLFSGGGETVKVPNKIEPLTYLANKKNPKLLNQTQPNYLINPYTIMINLECFGQKYKYLDSIEDILDAYAKIFPLFDEVITKYNKKYTIINTENQSELVNKPNINYQFKTQNSLQQNKLPQFNVPGLYSDANNTFQPIEIQNGGNDQVFYRKYLKYKQKYLSLKNH